MADVSLRNIKKAYGKEVRVVSRDAPPPPMMPPPGGAAPAGAGPPGAGPPGAAPPSGGPPQMNGGGPMPMGPLS